MFHISQFSSIDTIVSLDELLNQSLERNFHEPSQQIEWTSLAVKFQTYIDLLTFSLMEQQRVEQDTQGQKVIWALQAMKPGNFYGLPFWLEQYNEMMTGQGHLRPDKPLLQLYMETRWRGTCDESYVQDVKALWTLTQTTQIRGHLAILNAEQILKSQTEVPNINARALMEERKEVQTRLSGQITCSSFDIANTLNLAKCEASNLGFGLIPSSSVIELECAPGFHPSSAFVTCPTEESPQTASCQACNCDPVGSVDNNCQGVEGQCQCKDGFYGVKCETANCDGEWEPWRPAICPCGSGKTQTRGWNLVFDDNADEHCEALQESRTCFTGCCEGQFDCGGETCLAANQECDYK